LAAARGGVDQVRSAIAQALERHLPAPGVVLPDAAQGAAAFIGDPDLGGEPEEPVAHVEEADRSGLCAGRLEDGLQRRLERVLGRLAGGDRAQAIGECRSGVRRRRRHRGRPAEDPHP